MTKKRFNFKITDRIIDHLINAILIFASVFIAFWMNEIREKKSQNEYTNNAKEAILSELKNNLSVLERWTPYHKEILDKRDKLSLTNIDTAQGFRYEKIPGLNNGIQREIITNSGWSLLMDKQVSLDIKTKMLINKTYEQQEYVTNASSRITNDFLNSREIFDNTKTIQNYMIFYSFLGELWGQEVAMIESLKYTISEMEE